jgi:hypothetical protein
MPLGTLTTLPCMRPHSAFAAREQTRAASFAAGLLTGREDARMEAAMKAATEAYADLAKVKPFWR